MNFKPALGGRAKQQGVGQASLRPGAHTASVPWSPEGLIQAPHCLVLRSVVRGPHMASGAFGPPCLASVCPGRSFTQLTGEKSWRAGCKVPGGRRSRFRRTNVLAWGVDGRRSPVSACESPQAKAHCSFFSSGAAGDCAALGRKQHQSRSPRKVHTPAMMRTASSAHAGFSSRIGCHGGTHGN